MPEKRSRFDLVVFDWDGTLMDSAAAIALSLQSACRDLDLPVPDEERARYVIGLGLDDAMSHILPGLDASHYPRVRERYRVHFLAHDAGTALFPGAAETVTGLHESGFLLAVATGKSRRGLDRALGATGLRPYFHATRCADEATSKPHPAMLLELMGELGVASDRTLMIGDTTHDMGMARAAGVARLAATYGAHAKETLLEYEPLACVDNFDELRLWLAQNA
jgi:phosphoglycolate phosphatase